MKLGHHGYQDSNTEKFMNTINPKHVIIPNREGVATTNEGMTWLKNNPHVDYLYVRALKDDYGISATITENDAYLGIETKGTGFRNINGKDYYVAEENSNHKKNGVLYPIEYNSSDSTKSIEVKNYEELKKAIENNIEMPKVIKEKATVNKLQIKLSGTGTWTATDTITVKKYQNIALKSQGNITIKRDKKLNSKPIFNVIGALTIGEKRHNRKNYFRWK